MKVLDYEAVEREVERTFYSAWKNIKVKPASFWNRLKWKILGNTAFLHAVRHDIKLLKDTTKQVKEIHDAIHRGYYHIEVTMDDAGFSPLPCPLCEGEKKIFKESKMIMGWTNPLWRWVDIYEECPVCNGSGYKPALTKLEEKLFKEGKILREIEHP